MNKVIVVPPPRSREGDTRGKFGRRDVPWALFKLLILLPCLRQETLFCEPYSFRFCIEN